MAEEDEIAVLIPDNLEPDIQAENIPLDILYEDDQLLVVNKPKGMVVHPSPGHYTGTLVNALMYHCKDQLSGNYGFLRPRYCPPDRYGYHRSPGGMQNRYCTPESG